MLGEAYTPDDEEDSAAATVSGVWAYQASRWGVGRDSGLLLLLWLREQNQGCWPGAGCRSRLARPLTCLPPLPPALAQARYRVPLSKAVAGSWVLLEGVDATSERRGCWQAGLGWRAGAAGCCATAGCRQVSC